MKLLYILNTTDRVNNFSHASMMAARQLGVEFHIAGNWGYASEEDLRRDEQRYGIRIHQVDLDRSPYSFRNIAAYRTVLDILRREKIGAIHCNTPVGGLLGRLAGHRCKIRPVIYQAHGFHFYKGAPLRSWLLYYPVERWLASMTDGLITINTEDRACAEKFRLRGGGKTYYVPGVGINVAEFSCPDEQDGAMKRKELELAGDAVVVLSAGELNKNKNYSVVLSALAKCEDERIHYVLCGTGPEEASLRQQAKTLGIEARVHFLGFRKDLKQWLSAADLFVSASYREGLPRSVIEAMAAGLPCVVSDVRGNRDLIAEAEGGFLCSPKKPEAFACAISRLAAVPSLRETMGKFNLRAAAGFDRSAVIEQTVRIYRQMGLTNE